MDVFFGYREETGSVLLDGWKSMRKKMLLALALVSLGSSTISSADAVPDRGRKLYMSHCSKCHTNGQNLVKPSKPVVGSSVLATFATFRAYLDKPVGTMPHYPHLITDEAALKDLYSYVKSMEAAKDGSKDAKKSKKKSEKKSRKKGEKKAEKKAVNKGDKQANKKAAAEDQEKVLKELNKDIPKAKKAGKS